MVHGPIVEKSPVVEVSSVLANATVTLLVGGGSVGSTVAAFNGSVWVPVTGLLVAGQTVVATQKTTDGTSDPSPVGVPVVGVPHPLPSPVFESPMSTCMSLIRVGALVPAAELKLLVNGDPTKVAVQTNCARTDDAFAVNPAVALPVGAQLAATQSVPGIPASPSVPSLKIDPVVPPEGPLPAPGIGQPLTCGMTSLQLSGMVPAANLEFRNGSSSASALNVAAAYTAWGAPPLVEGPLEAKQTMARCERLGTPAHLNVGPAPPPGPAKFVADICPEVGKVKLKDLVPGARLTLIRRLTDNANPSSVSETTVADAGVSSTQEEFFFDAASLAPPPGKTAMLTAQMTQCNTVGPKAAPAKLATAGPVSALVFGAPLFDCARFILLKGGHVGALLQPFRDDGVTPIGDPAIVADPTVRLATWFPLHAGARVVVKQVGCGANATIGPEPVQPMPNPLPIPKIVGPVRPGAALIQLQDTIPGAMVHLLVNNAWRVSLEAPDKSMQLPAGLPPLADRDRLWAVQTLCDRMSSLEGNQTVVTQGTMLIGVSPKPVTRGVDTLVTVSAKDKDTGVPIVGAAVTLGGASAGTTSTAFHLLSKPGTGSPIPGVVRQQPAYADAPFGVDLVDPPPPPPVTGKLTLNIGNPTIVIGALQITSATWTITPAWGAPAMTAFGTSAVVTIPKPPPGTAPANARVDVSLVAKATANGGINGYYFAGVFDCQNGPPNPVGVAWSGSNLAAGWLPFLDMPTGADGNPTIVVTLKWISTVPN
jgi:hypothetical protein